MASFFKIGSKGIKRPVTVLISVLLVCAITVCSVYATDLINGTNAENAATPKYYSAIKDWKNTNNTADSDNIFSYQFALDGANPHWDYMSALSWGYWYTGDTDYTNFSGITEEEWSEKFATDTFKHATGIGPKGYMRLWNRYGGLDLLDSVPAVALTYTAKEDGYVNIAANSVSAFFGDFTKDQGYRALVRITKNGENLYPASGYLVIDETATAADFEELDIQVSKGDSIRFELTSDTAIASTHSIAVSWNPNIYVRTEAELYTDTDDIYNDLTHFMETVFKGKTSETMDSTASDALKIAEANANESKYSVYTAIDSVYSGGIIPSGEDSVWKYAVVSGVPSGFENPDIDYGLKAVKNENGITLSWNSSNAEGLKALKVACDGKQYTYMSKNGDTEINIPLISDSSYTVQLSGKSGASEIIEINGSESSIIADSASGEDIIYLDLCVKSGSYITSVCTVSNEAIDSSYQVYCSYDAARSSEAASNRRTIVFSGKSNEQMMFGFTAPQSGDYEILAPIEAESREVKYSILKQDEGGEFTVKDGPRNYENDKSGYYALVSLKEGETVWLNSEIGSDTQIDIGIPRVTLKEETADSNGTAAYKYRAIDYTEHTAFNNRTYNWGSLTERSGAVWEFGSFENPIETVDDVTNNDTLGYMNYAKGDDATELVSLFKPYELLRASNIYNSLTMAITSNGAINATHGRGVPGTLHAITGTSYEYRANFGLPYLCKGFMIAVGLRSGNDGATHNMGIYMKFTAPTSGNITLDLSPFAEARTGSRVLVINGSEVVATYSVIPKGEAVDLGFMEKGESAYICYGINTGAPYNYGGFPIATVSGEKYSISLDNNSVYKAENADYLLTDNEQFVLSSDSAKIGRYVVAWTDSSGNTLNGGATYTVTKSDNLKAVLRYYGDLTGDANINATDLASMRLSLISNDNDISGDITSDDELNLKDLVRLKKWLAGYTVAFNEQ